MTPQKQRFMVLCGVGLMAFGVGLIYIPLAFVLIGAVILIEVLTSGPASGSDK